MTAGALSRAPDVISQRAIRQSFGQMQPADFFGAVEIGQRPRHAQHAMIAARGKPHGFRRIAQQFCALRVRLRDGFQQRGRRFGIGADIRFSTPQQKLGDSLRRQTEKAAKYAAEHGLTLDTELKMTDAGVSAFRGKNASTGALGGFVRAVESGYLVCSRANMRAQGCKYLAVPYRDIEKALRENAGWLLKEAPRGKNTGALDREIAGLVTMVDHYSGEASDLADLAAQEKSPIVRQRLRDKMKELGKAQESLRTITAQRDTLTTASVRDRLKAVKNTLEADTVAVVATNQALRQAISRIVLDPEKARMELYWHHAPENVQVIHFYTRHARWEAGGYGLSDHGPAPDTKAS
jgi:hypothetical protein